MFSRSPILRGILYLAFTVTSVGALSRPASADTKPVSAKEDVSRLPADAAQLYADVTLFPRQMNYREIPWLLDLDKGVRLAKEEKRPLVLWTSGDDPLERC